MIHLSGPRLFLHPGLDEESSSEILSVVNTMLDNPEFTDEQRVAGCDFLEQACRIASETHRDMAVFPTMPFFCFIVPEMLRREWGGNDWRLHGARVVVGPIGGDEHITFGFMHGEQPEGWYELTTQAATRLSEWAERRAR